MAEKIRKKGDKLPELEGQSELVHLSDDDLDKVAGGGNGLTVDYYEDGYCPFCEGDHEVIRCQEQVMYNNNWFNMSFCPVKHKYFFKASNGYFDWNGNMIWGWM